MSACWHKSQFGSSRPRNFEIHKFSFQAKISPSLSLTTRLPISCSFNPNDTWHIHSYITSLKPSYVGLLAQELVLGAADLETLKYTSFEGKISPLLSLTTRLPISCSFNPNETWQRHSHITSLQPSYIGLLAQELVLEHQTQKL